VPLGYGLAVVALPVFALAGLGDLVWHTFVGIERDLVILFSPTHLALITAMIVILTAPLRSAWVGLLHAPSLGQLLPALLGLSFATTLVLLFVMHSNALTWYPGGVVEAFSRPGDTLDGPSPVALAGAVTVTNIVLLAPLLLLARRFVIPVGATTIVFAAAAGLSGAVTAFENRAIIGSAVLAGLLVEAVVWRLRPAASRRAAYLGFAALAGLVTWSVYLAAASIAAGRPPAVIEYWTGVPIVAALHGLLLAVLFVPSLRPGDQPHQRSHVNDPAPPS
jgi:hypothetical protein